MASQGTACAELGAGEGPTAEEQQPLLPSPVEEALWNDVEAAQECSEDGTGSGNGGGSAASAAECSVRELLGKPAQVLQYLQAHGVRCTAEFQLEVREQGLLRVEASQSHAAAAAPARQQRMRIRMCMGPLTWPTRSPHW